MAILWLSTKLNSCAHWVSSTLTLLIHTNWCWSCCCCPQLGQLHWTGQQVSGHWCWGRSNL